MDNYLASGSLAEAENFVVNFNFDFLKGCPFMCKGCFVNKDEEKFLKEEELKNLNKLLHSLKTSMYKPFIAFIGPTDFLVSDNTEYVFSNPEIVNLLRSFKRISVQTTYLNLKNSGNIIRALDENFSDREVEINIIVDPARIEDDKYLKVLEKNRNEFLSELGRDDVRVFGIMNVYDYDETKIAELLNNYDYMHSRVEHLFETTIDYNFSMGRKPNLSADEFENAAFRIKDLFNQAVVSNEKAQYLRFSFGKLTDSLIEKQYNYLNGKIFFSPLLYERYVSFDDAFEIKTEKFSAEELEAFELNRVTEQYSYAHEMNECEECMFLGSCVDRGILFLMKNYGIKECLVAKKALEVVNGVQFY